MVNLVRGGPEHYRTLGIDVLVHVELEDEIPLGVRVSDIDIFVIARVDQHPANASETKRFFERRVVDDHILSGKCGVSTNKVRGSHVFLTMLVRVSVFLMY